MKVCIRKAVAGVPRTAIVGGCTYRGSWCGEKYNLTWKGAAYHGPSPLLSVGRGITFCL